MLSIIGFRFDNSKSFCNRMDIVPVLLYLYKAFFMNNNTVNIYIAVDGNNSGRWLFLVWLGLVWQGLISGFDLAILG